MAVLTQSVLKARKTPVQERATATMDAVYEATIQVLLAAGSERLTTTWVAERAGVSVGTLYQYYPNKQALLFAVLARHLGRLAEAIERVAAQHHGCPLQTMVEALVGAFVETKFARADVSKALYAIAPQLDGEALSRKMTAAAKAAVAAMLVTAPDARFDDLEFTVMMLFAAMAGATREVLQAGASPRMQRMLRLELVRLCQSYLAASAAAAVEQTAGTRA